MPADVNKLSLGCIKQAPYLSTTKNSFKGRFPRVFWLLFESAEPILDLRSNRLRYIDWYTEGELLCGGGVLPAGEARSGGRPLMPLGTHSLVTKK
jgi:hypothetical protein